MKKDSLCIFPVLEASLYFVSLLECNTNSVVAHHSIAGADQDVKLIVHHLDEADSGDSLCESGKQ